MDCRMKGYIDGLKKAIDIIESNRRRKVIEREKIEERENVPIEKASLKLGDLELRNIIPSLTTECHTGWEVVKWEKDMNGNSYCYTVVWWRRYKDGFYSIEFVGERPFKVDKIDKDVLWTLMKKGQELIGESSIDE